MDAQNKRSYKLEENMKENETENAKTEAQHKELDLQILELLRAMSPEKRRESVDYIRDTYGNRKAER